MNGNKDTLKKSGEANMIQETHGTKQEMQTENREKMREYGGESYRM